MPLKILSVLARFSALLLIFHYVASEGTVKEPSMPDMFLTGCKVLEKAIIERAGWYLISDAR